MRFCKCGQAVKSSCPRCDKKDTSRYDYQWQKLRNAYITYNPLCEDCLGKKKKKVKEATEVHHLQSIDEAPHLRLDASNLISLCGACHRKRHGKER